MKVKDKLLLQREGKGREQILGRESKREKEREIIKCYALGAWNSRNESQTRDDCQLKILWFTFLSQSSFFRIVHSSLAPFFFSCIHFPSSFVSFPLDVGTSDIRTQESLKHMQSGMKTEKAARTANFTADLILTAVGFVIPNVNLAVQVRVRESVCERERVCV